MTMDAALPGHLQELRRGTVVVASLMVLREPGYGYSLLETLSAAGFEVEANTLYPLLRRLETQGLLVSEWREEGKRNKRFYRLSVEGQRMLTLLLVEWRSLDTALDDILAETQHGTTGPIPASR